jgi:hypothetical protein
VAPNKLRASSTSRRPTVAQNPEHFMSDIWLQPVQGQDDLPMLSQTLLQAFRICQGERQQFLIAIELIGHGAAGDLDPSPLLFLMERIECCAVPDSGASRPGQSHPAQIRHVVMPTGPLPPVVLRNESADRKPCGIGTL